ncbi:galactokinase [Paenibacillus albidus]|uniref:Galactokinase n=1 Tax=Paenibacillus albidus TaxID=2041023 RepID=A0A917FDQ1_9BACL|nr:galactokinase family protein [Paenibacillus albidus]GGF71563.1 galactokinase [Paenibacillus albidus]
MPSITETLELLGTESLKKKFNLLYGDDQNVISGQIERYSQLIKDFEQRYGGQDVYLFSSPGRSEISGNHTDHNLGKVIAASINMDCIGVAEKTDDPIVSIKSITYNEDFTIDLSRLEEHVDGSGTETLVRGILKGFGKFGFATGGFKVCITSDVISAAGVSSSASFEMLISSILNYFYNDNRMDVVACAKIGQYAENIEWDKQSGLLDQIACGYGGLITIDFADPQVPVIQNLDFAAINEQYDLLIVPTGANHANLSDEYSSIPSEMKAVAGYFGAKVLRELDAGKVLGKLAEVRAEAGDRAVLRALHFFEENNRVDQQVAALNENRAEDFLRLVTASGNSSWKWLQNCYSNTTPELQGVTLYLALTELFIAQHGEGACRVHGGGFAGVIMALLPKRLTSAYIDYMSNYSSQDIYQIRIRQVGSVNINSL